LDVLIEQHAQVKKLSTRFIIIKTLHPKEDESNNAFLHGDLHEEIYIKLPPGIHTNIRNAVSKLNKSLYGLKQASRQWYAKLSEVLYRRGYKDSENDHSLFFKSQHDSVVFLAIYVDDILLIGNDEQEITSLKAFLDATFKIKDLGPAYFFLGIEVLQTHRGLLLTQRKFTMELLQEYDCLLSTPVICPLDYSSKLSLDEGPLLSDPTAYRRLVGKLNFLTNAHPDIAFSVQHLSQFLQQPREPHLLHAAFHVLRYLKKEPSLGISLNNSPTFDLLAYCDEDWAACSHSRRSVSGFVIFFANALISWKSKKQSIVSLSSAEAEYRSLRRVAAELAWLTRLLRELTITSITPIPVKTPNISRLTVILYGKINGESCQPQSRAYPPIAC